MKDKELYKSSFDDCPLTFALNVIGGKWRLPIIWALSKYGTLRYNELKRNIEGITNMMLTQTLKDLELYNIIERQQYMEVPPRVEYGLTDHGVELIQALKQLARWGEKVRKS